MFVLYEFDRPKMYTQLPSPEQNSGSTPGTTTSWLVNQTVKPQRISSIDNGARISGP